MATSAASEERQVTFSAKNHNLDNNDNFSADGRYLCYDRREEIGPGIENCRFIEKVEIATGKETVLYTPERVITGERAAPGVGAASFCPTADKVVFIHGPPLDTVPQRGYYGKPNRNGAEVPGDGSGHLTWVDYRDVATTRDTLPGAHRGGTHRHEYTLDGKRIGFTYDDFLLPQYGRTIGYMEPHPDAPAGATHFFALLVAVVPESRAKPGDLVYAAGDSWVGRHGRMRAFIGKIRGEDNDDWQESLFVVDVPQDIDITTADSGSATRYPQPPTGIHVRRITHDFAAGIVRGTIDGDRIAYYALDAAGRQQVFVVPSDGSDRDDDPAKRPVQATFFEHGAGPGLRWHPSGNSIACISDNRVAVTCVRPGPLFGKSLFLTSPSEAVQEHSALYRERSNLVWSPDGRFLAFNRPAPTLGADGKPCKMYDGSDPLQIFLVDFPDTNHNGIADGLEP